MQNNILQNPINLENKKDLDKLSSTPQEKQVPSKEAHIPKNESKKSNIIKGNTININNTKSNNNQIRDFSNKVGRNSTALVKK